MSDVLAKYQPATALARADLNATRERARAQLAALEAELLAVVSWREFVRRHPVATLVGAFAVGLAVSQLWRRR